MTTRVLGIDPGLAATGFGVIEVDGPRMTPLWYGALHTYARQPISERLVEIRDACRDVLRQFEPQEAALEGLFFGADPRVALAVGQARGVMIVACAECGVETFEYSPAQIKRAVTGYGRADKEQVQRMVQATLAMTEMPQPNHAADALGAAICHAGAAAFLRSIPS